MWPWKIDLTFFCLSFLNCKVWILIGSMYQSFGLSYAGVPDACMQSQWLWRPKLYFPLMLLSTVVLLQLYFMPSSFLDVGWWSSPNLPHLVFVAKGQESWRNHVMATSKSSKWPKPLPLIIIWLWSKPHKMPHIMGTGNRILRNNGPTKEKADRKG